MSSDVHIKPGLEPGDVQIVLSGEDTEEGNLQVIMDAWNVSDNQLRTYFQQWLSANGYGEAVIPVEIWADTSPGGWQGAWLCEPTGGGWANQFFTDSSDPHPKRIPVPRVEVKPVSSSIAKIIQQPVIVSHNTFDTRGKPGFEAHAILTANIEVSTESHWDHTQTIGIESKVGVTVGPANAEETVSYEDSWGEGGSESKSISVGAEVGITKEIPADSIYLAAQVLQRGVLTSEILHRFEALDGYILGKVYYKHKGHHDGHPTIVYDAKYKGQGPGPTYASWIGVPLKQLVRFIASRVNSLAKKHPELHVNPVSEVIYNTQTVSSDFYASSTSAFYPLTDNTEDAIEEAVGGTDAKTVYVAEPKGN